MPRARVCSGSAARKRHAFGAQIFVRLIHVHAAHGADRLFGVSQHHRALGHQFARDGHRFFAQFSGGTDKVAMPSSTALRPSMVRPVMA